jgi:hypothetical protein
MIELAFQSPISAFEISVFLAVRVVRGKKVLFAISVCQFFSV